MKQRLRFTLQSLFFLLSLSLLSPLNALAAEPLQLNGIAEFNRLRTTFYIAALYTDTLKSQPKTLLDSQSPSRMEIRIVTEKWRSRSFSSYILGQIAINNSDIDLSKYTNEKGALQKVAQLAKDEPLTSGDTIAIEFNGESTSISFNDQGIAREPGKKLFNAFLRLWIGKRPPSRQFREDILQLADQGLIGDTIDLFLLLSPKPERLSFAKALPNTLSNYQALATVHSADNNALANSGDDTQILQAEAAALAASSAAKAAELAQAEAEKLAAVKIAALKASENLAKTEQDKSKVAQQAQQIAQQKAEAEKAKQEALRLKKLEQQAEQERKQKAAELAKQRKAREQQQNAEQQKALLAKKKAEFDYKSHLRTQVYKHVEYPARAYELGQEGTVVINVTINPKGKVQQSVVHATSNYKALDKAALKAAKRIKAPAFTEDMSQEDLNFLMRVAFRKK